MATLQQQGVPWKSRLGSQRQSQPAIKNQYIRTRTKTPEGSRTVTTHYAAPAPATSGRRHQFTPRQYNPANAGSQATGSIGALEGEFLVCLILLVLLMFANSTSSYGEKIMSFMKRGTLVCLLFFLLAIISNIGPNASKIAKAFGGLVIVAILITTPINTVITDVDSLIKNDWVGTSETGGDTAASADAGTGGGTSSAAQNAVNNATATLGNSAVSAMEAWLLHLSGPAASTVNNAINSILTKLHIPHI
jgi:hypothetical protein